MNEPIEAPETVVVQTQRCVVCKETGTVTMTKEHFRRWYVDKEHIQVVAPEMKAELREQLINGTHPKCWDTLFDV